MKLEGAVLQTTTTRSAIECTYICSVRSDCYAANYKRKVQNCTVVSTLAPETLKELLISDEEWDVYFIK